MCSDEANDAASLGQMLVVFFGMRFGKPLTVEKVMLKKFCNVDYLFDDINISSQ